MRALTVAPLLAALLALPACAQDAPRTACEEIRFDGAPFVVCAFARDADIRLMLDGADGERLLTLEAAQGSLEAGVTPLMAMNAGMYHADRAPVGLYIEGGRMRAPIQLKPGPGNFGMVPNGVFWSDGGRVHVSESEEFAAGESAAAFATQSGPMLVMDGALHPRFERFSESRKRRNGVGVDADTVFFAISDAPVNFHHFARLFRDELGAADALFLDGTVSRIHAPEIGRAETGGRFGPMVVVVAGGPDEPQ